MNGPTGQWILKIILPGLRIQSEILTDLRILNLQRFVEERRVQIFAGNKVEGNQDIPVKVRFSPLHVTNSKRIRI